MECIAIDAPDGEVSAGRAVLANREHIRVLFSFVKTSADSIAGVILAECSRMAIDLAVVALSASSVCDVIIQLTFTVTDNEVLVSNTGFLDGSCERYDDCEVHFMLPSVSWGEPSWCLSLNQFGVVS